MNKKSNEDQGMPLSTTVLSWVFWCEGPDKIFAIFYAINICHSYYHNASEFSQSIFTIDFPTMPVWFSFKDTKLVSIFCNVPTTMFDMQPLLSKVFSSAYFSWKSPNHNNNMGTKCRGVITTKATKAAALVDFWDHTILSVRNDSNSVADLRKKIFIFYQAKTP